jgi:carotenoid cleavage dioxygenase-like enzyme
MMTSYLDYAELKGQNHAFSVVSPVVNADGLPEAPVFLHEFATTEDYLVFFDNPLTFGLQVRHMNQFVCTGLPIACICQLCVNVLLQSVIECNRWFPPKTA